MGQSVSTTPPADRVGAIEQEMIRLRTELKHTTRQLSFLQLLFLLFAGAVGGGGYYLVKEGMLRIDGLSPEVVNKLEAKEFGLYNRDNTRVFFDGDDKFGNPRFTFLNPNKALRMRLMVWPDTEGGGGGITYYDSNGTGWRGQFRLAEDNTSLMTMRGEKQKGGIDISVAPDGSSELKMSDKSEKAGIAMKVDAEGTPSLVLTDKTGKTVWQTPVMAAGTKQ